LPHGGIVLFFQRVPEGRRGRHVVLPPDGSRAVLAVLQESLVPLPGVVVGGELAFRVGERPGDSAGGGRVGVVSRPRLGQGDGLRELPCRRQRP
jgi:hypothetical protein